MSWKKTLYEYVNTKNQAELEGSFDPFAAICEDHCCMCAVSRIAQAESYCQSGDAIAAVKI